MDTEEGIVITAYGRTAIIRLNRASACSHCKAGCIERDGVIITEAENPVGAKAGDMVSLGLNSKKALIASFMVFGLPLLALFIGAIATNFITRQIGCQSQILNMIAGITMFLLTFIPVKAYDKHLNKIGSCSITIVGILNNSS